MKRVPSLHADEIDATHQNDRTVERQFENPTVGKIEISTS